MSNVLSAERESERHEFQQVQNVNGGTGVCLSWQMISRMLEAYDYMLKTEFLAKVRVDKDSVHFYFEDKE